MDNPGKKTMRNASISRGMNQGIMDLSIRSMGSWATLAVIYSTLPTGGSTGQVLTKSGSGNYVVKWQDVVAKSVANQIDATSATYAIQLRTTSKYGSKPVFQIRMGSSGTH